MADEKGSGGWPEPPHKDPLKEWAQMAQDAAEYAKDQGYNDQICGVRRLSNPYRKKRPAETGGQFYIRQAARAAWDEGWQMGARGARKNRGTPE